MLPALPTMLSEGLSETRTAAKAVVAGLTREARASPAESERLDRLLRKNLSDPAYRKLRDSIDASTTEDPFSSLKMNGGPAAGPRKAEGRRSSTGGSALGGPPSGAPAAEGGRRGGGGGLGGVSGVGMGAGGSEKLNDLESIYSSLNSSDWATRIEAVTRLADLASEQGDALCARGKLLTLFDHLTPRLTDSNSKVNVVALQALQTIVPAVRDGLSNVVSSIVPALATSLASSNAQVRAITPVVLDSLVAEVEHGALVQPFANCALYSPPKARPLMIDKLRELSTSVYTSKPQLVIKHAVPTAFRLLEDNRADLRPGTVQLLRVLYVLLGQSLLDQAQKTPAAVQTRLNELIQSL